ncbi:MAG TPA: HAD-IA family hydrolase [Bryobacteraceae bacterium]|nr:HAD-IA family hydrolase [Bryobacteraceae bacterium]
MIVFDMDGVLVDVTESYRETIVQTVKHFSGKTIARPAIQDYKNQGGWNNDWALSQRILADFGMAVDYPTVVEEFQKIFFGPNGNDGLMQREEWIDTTGTLARLNERFAFSVFTGRLRDEAQLTLDRFAGHLHFARVIGDDDVTNGKPDPEGLLQLITANPTHKYFYIGDTVDDARSARAANVPFIGVGHDRDEGHAKTVRLMEAEGAIAIIESINELERVLPA